MQTRCIRRLQQYIFHKCLTKPTAPGRIGAVIFALNSGADMWNWLNSVMLLRLDICIVPCHCHPSQYQPTDSAMQRPGIKLMAIESHRSIANSKTVMLTKTSSLKVAPTTLATFSW